jgi:hypothetical protein
MLLTVNPSIRAIGYIEVPPKGENFLDWLRCQSTNPKPGKPFGNRAWSPHVKRAHE